MCALIIYSKGFIYKQYSAGLNKKRNTKNDIMYKNYMKNTSY